MATQTLASRQPAGTNWGRLILQADGAFCFACGVAFALDSAPLATFTGLPRALVLALGLILLPYGAALFLAARSARLAPRLLGTAALLNAAWVVASVALLRADRAALTTGGTWAVALVALVVADLAVAQFAIRRRAS